MGGVRRARTRSPSATANYPGIGAYPWGGSPRRHCQIDNGDPQRQDNFNYRFATSYITGSHAFKVGLQGLRGMYNTRGNVPAIRRVHATGSPAACRSA